MDAAEYKHIVLGLVFLKYIADSENLFYVFPRLCYLQRRAKLDTIGKDVDDAMEAIEKDNPSLKGVLPKKYAKEKLDKQSIGELIDILAISHWVMKREQRRY